MNYLAPAGPSLPHLPTFQIFLLLKIPSGNCSDLSAALPFPLQQQPGCLANNYWQPLLSADHEWNTNRQIYFSGRAKQWEKNELR
jgi:hypothetical protein